MIEIFPLEEGLFTVGLDKKFVPYDPAVDHVADRPIGSLLIAVRPFALIWQKEVIILDSGLGYADDSGELNIVQNLRKYNFGPEDVSTIIFSHLHHDHADGAAKLIQLPEFKHVKLVIRRQEMEYGLSEDISAYNKAKLEILKSHDNIQWLTEEEGEIKPGISYQHTGGHCPFHIAIKFDQEGHTLFYGGDEASKLQEIKFRFLNKYDFDGKRGMELRQAWKAKAENEHWRMLFYHDSRLPYFDFG